MLECFDPTGRGLVLRPRFLRLLGSILPSGKQSKLEELVAASGAAQGEAVDVRRFMAFLYGKERGKSKDQPAVQEAWIHTASTRTPEDSLNFEPSQADMSSQIDHMPGSMDQYPLSEDLRTNRVQNRASLFRMVRSQQVRLLRLDFIVEWFESNARPMPRRQDLPAKAFLNVGAMSAAEKEKLEIIAVSASWTSERHADPARYHLATLAELARRFRDSSPADEDEGEQVGRGASDGRPVGVFWDWVSLVQEPRSPQESTLYAQAMENIGQWYVNSTVTKWFLASMPKEQPSWPASSIGWRCFEREAACLATPHQQLLWISDEIRSELLLQSSSRPEFVDDFRASRGDVLQLGRSYANLTSTAKAVRRPPLSIDDFNAEIEKCHFESPSDREKFAKPQYAQAFHACVTDAAEHEFANMGFSTEDMVKFLQMLEANVEQLKVLRLPGNSRHEVSLNDLVALATRKSRGFQELACAGNLRMGGTVMSIVALGRTLRVLNLSKTQVTGNLQDLYGATLLSELNLSAAQVEGDIRHLSALPKLSKLDLHTSKVSGDIVVLSGLGHLEEVYLHWTAVSGDVSGLGTSRRLMKVYLNDTRVVGTLQGVSQLPSLQEVDLSSTQVGGDVAHLGSLRGLTKLRLWWTQVYGDVGWFAAHTELRELDLFKTQVQGDIGYLKMLRKLTKLDLDLTNVGGNVVSLVTLKSLRTLSLQSTEVVGDVEDIATLPELTELDVRFTQVGGDATSLMCLKNLQLAGLSDTQVVGDRRGLERYVQRNQNRMRGRFW